jgi:thioredoxin reductase (NADPH)
MLFALRSPLMDPVNPGERAAIVVIDDEAESLSRIQRLLTRRLGSDYDIVCESSATAGAQRLAQLHDDGRSVALILAGQSMDGMTGTELLAGARTLYPHAKRALVMSFLDLTPQREEILRAAAVGEIDTYVARPARDMDEAFFRVVVQFIDEWDREQRPQVDDLRIVGDEWDPEVTQLRDALQRSGISAGFYQHDTQAGQRILAEAGVAADTALPVVVVYGRAVSRPSRAQIADLLQVNVDPIGREYDVVVIGAGPGGLAAAVYAASEGLDVLVVDNEALGGQASTSTSIRNYLGFPRGISGSELTTRAYWQAWFFGAGFLIGRQVASLHTEEAWRILTLDDGTEVRTRSLVLASGVAYRRLGIESVERFVGSGVFYGAPITEAPAMAGGHVVVVGGGNSSAQSALFLARFAKRITLVVRGTALDEMSSYLVRDLESHPNIDVRLNTVLVDAAGDTRLRTVTLQDRTTEARDEVEVAAVFILIGAEPRTEWLPAEIVRDDRGYVITGAEIGRPIDGDRLPFRLETSMPGVFAVGDVRNGSMKRVAAAVGEGSSAIRHVHEYLALSPPRHEAA